MGGERLVVVARTWVWFPHLCPGLYPVPADQEVLASSLNTGQGEAVLLLLGVLQLLRSMGRFFGFIPVLYFIRRMGRFLGFVHRFFSSSSQIYIYIVPPSKTGHQEPRFTSYLIYCQNLHRLSGGHLVSSVFVLF